MGGITWRLTRFGRLLGRHGQYVQARMLLTESLRTFHKFGDLVGIGLCFQGLAVAAQWQGDYERATCLAGAASHLLETLDKAQLPDDIAQDDRELIEARAELGEAGF